MALDRDDRDAIVEAIGAGFRAANSGGGNTPSPTSGGRTDFGGKVVKDGVEGIARVLQQGGGRIDAAAKDMTKLLPGNLTKSLGAAGTSVITFIEDTQNSFQNLSKVGAGLGGNLGQLRVTAAETRMPLDTFANMVGNNTQVLAGFGKGVNDGVKNFAALSKALYEDGTIEGFMNLGMNLEEANEFVLKNTEITRRQSRLEGLNSGQQVEAAASLAKNMMIVAKLTGKEAGSMQDELIARQRNGATQARIRLLEMDGVTGASKAYAAAQTALEVAPDVVGDLFDDLLQTGAPMTEATQNFAAANGEAFALLQQAADANKRGDAVNAERLATEAAVATADFAQSRAGTQLATLGQMGGVAAGQAAILGEMGGVIDAAQANMIKINGNMVSELSFRQAFMDNLANIKTETTGQMDATNKGMEALEAANKTQVGLANTASAANVALGEHIETNSVLLNGYSTLIDNIDSTLPTELQSFIDGLDAMIPGTKLDESFGKMQIFATELEAAGLINTDTMNNLKTLLDGDASTAAKNLANAALEAEGVLTKNGQLSAELIQGLAKIRNDNATTTDTTTTEASGSNWFGKIWDYMTGDENQNALGTGGFKDFGKGKAQMLHGLESVVPFDSPQGALLDAFPSGLDSVSSMMQNVATKFDPSSVMKNLTNDLAATGVPVGNQAQELMASMSSPNTSSTGTTSEDGIESLNMTMKQLVQINSRQLQELQKQLKAVKGMDGNVLTNVGI